ncbi:metal ABC transporter substrate-binding protein [Demequina sp. SYSU T00192]|uniref:Metal ABC transporter substrate-binding protein n=1 Tax=Demequina litoralis TaxID=3051660 RepID=A0ABT8GBF4_9MICO|nr:metal ABC transporter substrate-binding protein [Demequina sp. SYSU T00192]MDN4476476.1 metal ABC transporter substrate-binding protein [Demequina sp. SYSU T00192]
MKKTSALIAAAAVSTLALTACSASDGGAGASGDASDASLTVATAFYPLQFVAEQVGGDLVEVVSMTPAGVEPHDVELSPSTVRQLGTADLALYLSDFQPAVDDAISTTGVEALDAAEAVELHAAEEHADEDEHAEEEDDHDHGSSDPHFWLDPELLAHYADAVGEAFAAADPDNADTYTANAEALHASLDDLDTRYTDGLAQCERDTIVTGHEAFGYLADAYGLHQEGVAGLDPESEPSPARILEIKDIIAETGATTIFTEDAVSASVAEALATDVGVETTVLSPVETVADGDDYIAVMTRNLATLEDALGCE